jgi:molybdate transport system permease protein
MTAPTTHRSDAPVYVILSIVGGSYLVLIVAMLAADLFFTTPPHLWKALASPDIRYAIRLSLISCSITAILSVWVAVPLGYLLSRWEGPATRPERCLSWAGIVYYGRRAGRRLADVLVDIPIVLPPLVIGLSLLILFQRPPLRQLQRGIETPLGLFRFPITYAIPSVIIAQFAVACAFAVRTMRVTFDQISPRTEQVALTLGCTRSQAFWMVVLPEARRGILTALTLAWARSLGEFGPVLVFSGATPMRTEVLPTSVFLQLNIGSLEAAVAVSLIMVLAAVAVLVLVRLWGLDAPLRAGA